MSVRALSWSFSLPLQDMAAKGVLHALADHADEDWKCWPSLSRIALFVGCSENTARRALQRVEAMGIISREARPGQSDMYRLNADFKTVADVQAKAAKTTVPYTKAEIPYLLRHAVFVRDGMACLHCGDTDVDHLTADHVVPEFHGGPNTMENLQTLCMPCNRKKGLNLDPSQGGTSHDGTPQGGTLPLPPWDLTPPNVGGDPSQGGTRTTIEPSRTKKITVKSAKRSSDERLGTRLPADFELTPDRRAIAEAEGQPPERTFAIFVDYWRAASGASAKKLDWDATWRNWCRRAADNRRTPARGGSGVRPSAIRDESSAFARAADILAGR